MKLTLRFVMQTNDGAPMPLQQALAMHYSGRLDKIAKDLNDSALDTAGLDHVAYLSYELEQTEHNETVLIINTAAIQREISGTKEDSQGKDQRRLRTAERRPLRAVVDD